VGQVIYTGSARKGVNRILVSDLGPGLYVLKMAEGVGLFVVE
jgi:hypothetical protein